MREEMKTGADSTNLE